MANSTAALYGSLHMISICLSPKYWNRPDIATETSRGFPISRGFCKVGKPVADLPLPKSVGGSKPYKSGLGLGVISLLTTPHPAWQAIACR